MEGRPKASPAWMVKWLFSRLRYSKASRCRVGGKPASAPHDVEADHAEVAVAVGELGDLLGAGGVPHRGEQGADADAVAVLAGQALAFAEALVDGLDDLFQGQPGFEVLFGCVADLGVDDAVGGQVLGALGGDPYEGLAGLHHADGVRERLQVAFERAGVGGFAEPGAEPVRVGLGQGAVARLAGEVDDGPRADATVEMVVQQHLGGAADLVRVREAEA